uniref:Essential meiotic structure-specific endonuclease subunit 2 n=1 Tax=Anser cygnoides TaxID=8845 RepID=A0A8B9DFD7_ANSCY
MSPLQVIHTEVYLGGQQLFQSRCCAWHAATGSSCIAGKGWDDSTVKTEEEKEVLVLVEPEDFLKRLFSLTQVIQISDFVDAPPGSQPDLNHVLPLASPEGSSTRTYSAAVVGLGAYRCNREQDRQQARSPAKQRPGSQPGPELSVTQREIPETLVVLQLWGNTEVLFLDTWQEFGEHVSALMKATAKLEKDGTGLWQVWEREIQQFNRVSPAMAAAIAEAYPSPSLLVQVTRMMRLLLPSDIPVRSDVGGQDRRLGPDLPRHIYLFMVSTDPSLVLDLTA